MGTGAQRVGGLIRVGAETIDRDVQETVKLAAARPARACCRASSLGRVAGSAIVLFGEPGKWRPSADLLAHTKDGVETVVRLGEPVGSSAGS
jgi:phosphatidylserine decarboxylase